ncbi:glycosyltransferase 87 family protein [Nonlabens sp.]|uniref:glycosyltransferase 87 family protein n=1 Tax=Nonlabens sp. TaxID=1888209 RepID=UPI0025D8B859|nr:glycosyltransferase 87 family protein [Nonlabens sp.]
MKQKLGNIFGIISIISAVLYAVFFSLSRKQFTETFFVYSFLFLCLYACYKVSKQAFQMNYRLLSKKWTGRFFNSDVLVLVLAVGVMCRLLLLTYTPNLSQDFFRFIWDGRQLLEGYNPYLYLPDEVMRSDTSIPNAAYLHANMGELSSGHYTNYPPLNQLFFAAAAFLGGKSVFATMLWMRVFIIIADVGIFFYGIKLLKLLGKSPYLILLYFLNPFVVIELTGNLHFDGMVAFLLLLSVYYLLKSQQIKTALFLAYGVLLKLTPLIVLPLLFRKLDWKRASFLYLAVGAIVLIGFLPFYSNDLIEKYSGSVALWFGNFEFNASVFYVIRAIGYELTGYNVIETAGVLLPMITFLSVLFIALKRKNEIPEVLLSSIVFSFFIYLLLSTTVHPWYLTIPLLFSIFTRYRFMLVWSFVVFLSYYTYSNSQFTENLIVVGLEYAVVGAVFLWEILYFKKNNLQKKLKSL